MEQVSIQGFPRQIPDGDPNRIDSLVVPGPAFSAAIGRAFVRVPKRLFGEIIFGHAQLTGKVLRIYCTKESKMIYCLHLSMQSLVAVML